MLRGTEAAHGRTVLRLKTGDPARVLDGQGNLYSVQIAGVSRGRITCRILTKEKVESESSLTLRLGQALVKGNKFGSILRQSVELGIRSLVPLRAERCVVKVAAPEIPKKMERWRQIIRSAAKQCGRVVIPEVGPDVQTVEAFCRDAADSDLKIIFWENATKGFNDLDLIVKPASVTFLTGPEGGFTAGEVEIAELYGFKVLSLGHRILRAETAPIVALSILQNLWGDLR